MRLIKAIIGGLAYLVFGLLFIMCLSIVVYLFTIPGIFKALYKQSKKRGNKPLVAPELQKTFSFKGREN